MPVKTITTDTLSYFKQKYDELLNGKQDALESGANIKTINNESILGSGNISVGGAGGSSEPYEVQDFQLDLSEEEFECSNADAEYIFTNKPVAISLGGTIAVARDFTDDESKSDYSRSYVFFEFPDDDQVIYYELGLYWDGSEYSFDVKPTDPIGGGSGNEYYDFDEADMADQSKLAEVYNLCPMTLRAHTVHDGIQMYRLQNDYRTENNQIFYSCLLFGDLVEFNITESSGTYSINIIRYGLTPVNNN